MASLGAWSDEEQERTQKGLDEEMAAALKDASKYGSVQDGHIPPLSTMFEDVFKDMPAHLRKQMGHAVAEQGS